MLSVQNHDRDIAGLTYVYPVVSRRAGGVSLGINLNPNNACNWQCVYCQVPNLSKGVAPATDIEVLSDELGGFLDILLHGDYMRWHVPQGCRELKDIAISGNGEPTTCPNFEQVVDTVIRQMQAHALEIPIRLITNGSTVHKPQVLRGLTDMAACGGEVWFKVDDIGEQATQSINGVRLSDAWQKWQLAQVAELCPTWIQTCVVQAQADDENYVQRYVSWLNDVLAQGVQLRGVLLYSLARPSMQPGGEVLQAVNQAWLHRFAESIESLGLSVKVS